MVCFCKETVALNQHLHHIFAKKNIVKEEVKDAARTLFLDGWSQKGLSKLLNVSERTMTTWAKEGEWDGIKLKQKLADEQRVEHIKEILDYHLFIEVQKLRLSKESFQSGALTADKMHITHPNLARMLTQLMTYSQKKEANFFQTTNIMTDFMEHIALSDPPFAERVSEFTESFIRKKIKD
jgi:DNA-binding XRE family transcriptional regulator